MNHSIEDSMLFSGISRDEITSLLTCLTATPKHFQKGEIILSEGTPTDRIGIVQSGMAVISCCDVWGNHNILGNALSGDLFAEAYACIPNEPLQISVTAAEHTTVLFINVKKLLCPCTNACAFHAKLIQNLLTICAEKNLQLARRMLHISPKSIRSRLLSYFSACVKKTGNPSFVIPYNRQQLADYLGVDRSAMSHELSKMQHDGLIRYEKNHFTVIDSCF